MAKAKLLVVEDEKHLLYGLSEILTLDDYEVLTAENGEQGLEILKQQNDFPPDLIISDINMPRMDGIEFLKRVHEEEKWISIPFIFLTARGEREDVRLGKNLGVDEYIIKPFDADELLNIVQARLKRYRAINKAHVGMVSELKKKILTMMNHEFRTPLTLVVAYADMLKEYEVEEMSEDQLLQFLKGVNSGAERLRRLIENFILLVEIDTGDARKNYEWRAHPVEDVTSIIDPAVNGVVLDTSSYTINVKIQENLPTFMGDVDYLCTAMRELVDNAVKFSEKGTTIDVSVTADQQYVYFSVKDEGRGVPEEEREKIWETFYQINRVKLEDQGAGAGLAIVDGIVQLHGGKRLLQTEVDRGSTFTMAIPC